VSTQDQDLSLQLDALYVAGCDKVFEDRASGVRTDRTGLQAALDYVRDGGLPWGRSLLAGRRRPPAFFAKSVIKNEHGQATCVGYSFNLAVVLRMDRMPSRPSGSRLVRGNRAMAASCKQSTMAFASSMARTAFPGLTT